MKLIFLLAVALLAAAIVPSSASAESYLFGGPKSVSFSEDERVFISGEGETKVMELKATNNNGKTRLVSDYEITADNVITVPRSGQVTVFSNSDVEFSKALVSGNEVPISDNGIVSFAGYGRGTYVLNVVIDDKYAYEAIIVIGQYTERVINNYVTKHNHETNTKSNTEVNTEVKTIFKTVFNLPKHNDKQEPKDIGHPYCDLVADDYKGTCNDRQDADENTGLTTCRDGSKVTYYRDCKDAGQHPDEVKYPIQYSKEIIGADLPELDAGPEEAEPEAEESDIIAEDIEEYAGPEPDESENDSEENEESESEEEFSDGEEDVSEDEVSEEGGNN